MTINDFGTRIFVKGKAWHDVGIRNETGQSAVETLKLFTNGVPQFTKEEVYVGENKTLSDDFAIVRGPLIDDPRKRIIGYCGKGYHIVDPYAIAETFDLRVNQVVESLGFLGHGEKGFLSWGLPKSKIVVGKDDELDVFGNLLAGFDAKVSIMLMIATYRAVCGNTYGSLYEEGKQNKSQNGSTGRVWVGKHNSPHILRDLGAWMGHVQLEAQLRADALEKLFNKIDAFPVNTQSLADILFNVYPVVFMPTSYPAELVETKNAEVEKANELSQRDRENVAQIFDTDKTCVNDSGWKLFNAVTQYENYRDSKKNATVSILYGQRAKRMNFALSTINDWSNK